MRYTLAPCLASAMQQHQPMPELPPVTSAVLPAVQVCLLSVTCVSNDDCAVSSASSAHIACHMQGDRLKTMQMHTILCTTSAISRSDRSQRAIAASNDYFVKDSLISIEPMQAVPVRSASFISSHSNRFSLGNGNSVATAMRIRMCWPLCLLVRFPAAPGRDVE